MNLAIRDIRYNLGRFLLTGLGLGLLIGVVMSMAGIYRGFVVEATAILAAAGADLWVVQKDTRGPFAESSRVQEDLYRSLAMIPGVQEAAPVSYQNVQAQHAGGGAPALRDRSPTGRAGRARPAHRGAPDRAEAL